MASTIEIFCCYAREDQPLLHKLKTHLMPLQWEGLITIWSDTDINAGVEWEQEINNHLNTAHIILLLISSDFMASEYCYSKEMKRAMERYERGEVSVIPILVRSTYWKGAPFDKLQVLPTNAKPVTDQSWHTEDDALLEVAEQIGLVVKKLRIKLALAEASKLILDERFEEAQVIYDQIIQLDPVYAPAYLGKGEALFKLERYEESLISFDTALKCDPTVGNTHYYERKAFMLSKLQRYEESLSIYDKAIHLNPLAVHLYKEKAEALDHLQRFQEVLALYEQLIHLEPNKAEHYQQLGDLLLELGRSQQALETHVQAILLEPKIGAYYAKEGDLFLKLKRYEGALNAYETGIQLDINAQPYLYQGKGQALFGLERYEEALTAFEQALHLDEPNPDPEFYHDKGVIHEYLAKRAYQREEEARLHWKSREEAVSPIHFAIRVEAFTVLYTLTGHTKEIYALAFSPDGRVLASGGNDSAIKLWDMQARQELRTLTGHRGGVCGLAFSPDGQILASGGGDATIKLWGIPQADTT